MSGFFSLGGKEQDQDQQTDNNNSLFLFKNEEIYNKGFELWQQYNNQLHQQRLVSHHQHHTIQDVHFSIGPSNLAHDPSDYSYGSSSSSAAAVFRVMNSGRGRNVDVGVNCQDCGNQAKKDCVHMRCRTCCKSRGFPCPTHVKSTWVPAAKRREKQQQQQQQPGSDSQQDQQQLTVGVENPKRLRENHPGGGFRELGRHLPPEVNSPAFFRCVKVSATDDAEEHFAYQTAVNIGGHVFKGILYDQGPESHYTGSGGGESSSACAGSQQQSLDLIGATTSNPMLDPSMNYPTHHLSSFMAGTQFFPPPRP
ncbi:protein SHI RELATED SEQUENCE 5 [Sesamum alatum]|uniref:Protein SHI RELATED SEQUENCE 5 n=1 Tax=Sesamum alatum TaxID=300844 RepID=A0AAE1YQX6_9LAMI|nr:protein SHI RELATED SEQUENCE 5 [Sesamum alatum]